eukprot:6491760-Prymnesium_polylepis.1
MAWGTARSSWGEQEARRRRGAANTQHRGAQSAGSNLMSTAQMGSLRRGLEPDVNSSDGELKARARTYRPAAPTDSPGRRSEPAALAAVA